MKKSAGLSSQQTYPNQQDPVVSPGFRRIFPIQSNLQDSLASTRFAESDGLAPTASSTSSHRPPQFATARGSQPGSIIHRRGSLRTSSGSWVIVVRAQSPLFVIVVSRPVSPCGPFSLWPQAFLVYVHGTLLFMSFMPAGPVSCAYGLYPFISKGPCPIC